MKNYEKPVVMVNEGLAEGVYAASGGVQVFGTDECWKVNYVGFTSHADKCEVQINADHVTTEASKHQMYITISLVFNKDVYQGWNEGAPVNLGNTVTVTAGTGTANPGSENKTWNETVYAMDGDNAGLVLQSASYHCGE